MRFCASRVLPHVMPISVFALPMTMALMRAMADAGELAHLTAERVWKETKRAWHARAIAGLFQTLRDCHALKVLFPEIDALYGVPAPAVASGNRHGVHTLMTLTMAAMLSPAIGASVSPPCATILARA